MSGGGAHTKTLLHILYVYHPYHENTIINTTTNKKFKAKIIKHSRFDMDMLYVVTSFYNCYILSILTFSPNILDFNLSIYNNM